MGSASPSAPGPCEQPRLGDGAVVTIGGHSAEHGIFKRVSNLGPEAQATSRFDFDKLSECEDFWHGVASIVCSADFPHLSYTQAARDSFLNVCSWLRLLPALSLSLFLSLEKWRALLMLSECRYFKAPKGHCWFGHCKQPRKTVPIK